MKKKGFTLVEMAVVVIVLAIMISMIPFRMKSLQEYTKFSLIMHDWEDYRQKTVTSMRQSNKYKEGMITLSSTWATVLFSWGILWSWQVVTENMLFPENMILNTTWDISRTIGAYWLACPSEYDTWFQLTLWGNSACYYVDKNACNLIKISCKRQ